MSPSIQPGGSDVAYTACKLGLFSCQIFHHSVVALDQAFLPPLLTEIKLQVAGQVPLGKDIRPLDRLTFTNLKKAGVQAVSQHWFATTPWQTCQAQK